MKHLSFLAVALGASVLLLAVPAAVHSASPSNDNFADATVITSFPSTDTVDTSLATTEVNEPLGDYPYADTTVWYVIAPSTTTVVKLDTSGSSTWYSRINVYKQTGSGFGGLSFVTTSWLDANVTFKVPAGSTYYVQAGTVWGNYGSLQLNFSTIAAPSNDAFADSEVITSLPFSDPERAIAATFEQPEPTPSCAPQTPDNSWWYSFTPTVTQHITAHADSGTWTTIAAFTGDELSSLQEVKCRSYGGATFSMEASAGTTYHFQVSDVYSGSWGGLITFSLENGWSPQMYFGFWPQDPSVFDNVEVQDQSIDYGGEGIASIVFDFGDGTKTPAGEYGIAYHKYARDGDYTVTDTATTNDGRVGTTTHLVQVRTHDVTILSLVAPKKGMVGKQGTITVGIGNTRYAETVQVDLYKVTPQGDVLVGTSIQSVRVMKLKQTVAFTFNYVFTTDDAAIAKAPFKAVATIQGARDAANGDNTATAPPTLVTK